MEDRRKRSTEEATSHQVGVTGSAGFPFFGAGVFGFFAGAGESLLVALLSLDRRFARPRVMR